MTRLRDSIGWLVVRLRPLLLLGLAVGCTTADAAKPLPPRSVELTLQASGDSALGGFHWLPAQGATSYRWIITASAGTWIYRYGTDSLTLRGAVIVRAPSGSAVVLDSTYFTACVKSLNASDSSAYACTAPKRPRRPPAPPPLVVWDSLKIASVQFTASFCDATQTPDSLRWVNYNLDALTCPPVAWFAGRSQLIARDAKDCVRTCPYTGSMLENPKVQWCGWVLLNGNPPTPTCPNA